MADKKLVAKSDELLANVCFKVASRALDGIASGSSELPPKYCIKSLRLAADRGHLLAMARLGTLLLRHGATRTDKRKGIEYLVRAAKRDNPDAQYELGRIYELGLELYCKDSHLALHWYSLAAEGGCKSAARCLADAYGKGRLGVMPSGEKAEHWRELLEA
ncbi:MAG: SEL1-like repeat protein [Gammaproteobacteria bacterium]|nr:SEL1-like repeat protein [Gammaproteobacteria bacterium]